MHIIVVRCKDMQQNMNIFVDPKPNNDRVQHFRILNCEIHLQNGPSPICTDTYDAEIKDSFPVLSLVSVEKRAFMF